MLLLTSNECTAGADLTGVTPVGRIGLVHYVIVDDIIRAFSHIRPRAQHSSEFM